MRRRRLPARPRPALPQRAVVAFLEPPSAAIEAFRAVHDPLADAMPAHVTLVFPFASSLTDLQLAAHVRRVARRWPTLPIALSSVAAYNAQWVHLSVTRGSAAITELHDRLYRGVLAPFLRREFGYEPHVTIGRADDASACAAALDVARVAFRQPLNAMLRELSIVTITGSGRVEPRAHVALA